MRTSIGGCLAVLLLAAGTASALDDQSLLWVYWIEPRAGMETQFEQALQAHHVWRREQDDPWTWIVWRIASGPRSGTYAVGAFNRQWADFDNPPVAPDRASANYRATIAPYVESIELQHYTHLGSFSHSPAELPPRKLSITEEFHVHVGAESAFEEAAARIDAAIRQTNTPLYYEWWRLDTGGKKPLYARVRLLWSFAEINEPQASLRSILEQAYGEREAAAIAAQFNDSVRSRSNRMAIVRPDLYYLPTRD